MSNSCRFQWTSEMKNAIWCSYVKSLRIRLMVPRVAAGLGPITTRYNPPTPLPDDGVSANKWTMPCLALCHAHAPSRRYCPTFEEQQSPLSLIETNEKSLLIPKIIKFDRIKLGHVQDA
jgi:hypothetical protein